MTSLHWAAENGHTEIVKILLANVSTKDNDGKKDNDTYNTCIYILFISLNYNHNSFYICIFSIYLLNISKYLFYICNYSISK